MDFKFGNSISGFLYSYLVLNRIRKSKKDRQCNGQKKKDKQRSAKHTHKTKDRVTRTRLKPGVDSGAPEMWEVYKSTFRRQTNHYVQIIEPPKDTVEKQRTTD